MIIVSDNRATNAIIDLVGMEAVAAYLARAGWRDTMLARRMMDLEARERGRDNFSTPRDTADQLRRLCAGHQGGEHRHSLPGILGRTQHPSHTRRYGGRESVGEQSWLP